MRAAIRRNVEGLADDPEAAERAFRKATLEAILDGLGS